MMLVDMLGTVYEILKDILSWLTKRFDKPDPADLLKQRLDWRDKFINHLQRSKDSLIYGDAIIRDISKMDNYPETNDDKKGISAWFRVEIKDLYDRGLEVIVGVHSLTYDENHNRWRYSQDQEQNTTNSFLVGQIPFDGIRYVDWRGDFHYSCPHIYCKFSKKEKQPYESLVYYILQGSGEHLYFEKIANIDEVVKQSKKSC